MRHISATRYLPKGFSLIELMIFVALLMIILNIAYSAFSDMNPRIREIMHVRNAKSIVAAAECALIAGAAFKTDTRNGMVAEVIQGIRPPLGIFKDKTFVVPNLQVTDLEGAALKYISLSTDGTLGFDPAGKQSAR
jgi:hypothetical protein